MKSISKMLHSKYINETNNEKAKLSRFLKRRRIELGKTLEEVSDGVCSTSYLSKIENCIVDVDESYFKMLFEKLDLEYQAVVSERSKPIYDDMIKAYLLEDYKTIEEKTNLAIENRSYSDTEIEILLILYNLTTESFQEAERCIQKLEVIKNTLSTEELEYLSFLKILYYFKTYQYDVLEKTIEVTIDSIDEDSLLYFVLNELMLEYCFWTNKVVKYIEWYNKFKENKYLIIFNKIKFKHILQRILIKTFDEKVEVGDLEQEFNLVKESTDESFHEEYQFYYSIYLIKCDQLEKAYILLKQLNKNQRVLCVLAYVVNKMNNMTYAVEYLNHLEQFEYVESTPFTDYIEYVRLKLEQYSYSQLYHFLKTKVLERQLKYCCESLYQVELKEYYSILFELGKYKEIAKHILNK